MFEQFFSEATAQPPFDPAPSSRPDDDLDASPPTVLTGRLGHGAPGDEGLGSRLATHQLLQRVDTASGPDPSFSLRGTAAFTGAADAVEIPCDIPGRDR